MLLEEIPYQRDKWNHLFSFREPSLQRCKKGVAQNTSVSTQVDRVLNETIHFPFAAKLDEDHSIGVAGCPLVTRSKGRCCLDPGQAGVTKVWFTATHNENKRFVGMTCEEENRFSLTPRAEGVIYTANVIIRFALRPLSVLVPSV